MFELFLAQSRLNSNNAQAEKSRENAVRSTVNSQNLIIIVKQTIDKTAISRIDKRMQMTLKLWTYLEWPNKSSKSNSDCKNGFWQKLAACIHNSLNRHYQSIV